MFVLGLLEKCRLCTQLCSKVAILKKSPPPQKKGENLINKIKNKVGKRGGGKLNDHRKVPRARPPHEDEIRSYYNIFHAPVHNIARFSLKYVWQYIWCLIGDFPSSNFRQYFPVRYTFAPGLNSTHHNSLPRGEFSGKRFFHFIILVLKCSNCVPLKLLTQEHFRPGFFHKIRTKVETNFKSNRR